MARTVASDVQALLQSDYNSRTSPSLTVHIASANVLVTRVAACAVAKGIPLTSEELELIERWLAAHYYVMVDQALSEKQTADARAKYQGTTGVRLEASKYGQAALSLDTSGCLNDIAKSRRASIMWPGKVPSEQIPYTQRD